MTLQNPMRQLVRPAPMALSASSTCSDSCDRRSESCSREQHFDAWSRIANIIDKKCFPLDRLQPNGASQSNRRISIVIADYSELYREMLKMVIEAFPSLFVLGTVCNGCRSEEHT